MATLNQNGHDQTQVSHTLPLPMGEFGRRTIALDLGLKDKDWLDTASTVGTDITKALDIHEKPGGNGFLFDAPAAADLFRRRLIATGVPLEHIAPVDEAISRLQAGVSDGTVSTGKDARETIESISLTQVLAR